MINGVDLSKIDVGNVVEAPNAVAVMLIRESWAELLKNGNKIANKRRVNVLIVRQPSGNIHGIALHHLSLRPG